MNEPPSENGATPELVARYALAGFYLATTIEAHEALTGGLPVPRNLLKPDRLAAIGEKPYGHDLILTPDLALACELAQQAGQVDGDQPTRTLTFTNLQDFLKLDYPPRDPLLGRTEDMIYLARSTFLLLYGDGGAAKSTLTIDAAAHLAAGQNWLGIHVPRPARILLIENEGGASFFQAMLQHKVDTWDGPADWAANVIVYTEPWSRYTFASEAMRTELAEYCATMNIDVVMANPLFGIGGPGTGRPEETGLFIDWMKEAGLWDKGPAFWLIHHNNKLGQISGDWNRQPDTTIHLEQDGEAHRSKLTWEKTRLTQKEPEGWRRIMVLDWILDSKGFQPLDIDPGKVTDSQLTLRLDEYLEAHPWESTNVITRTVKGTPARLGNLLREGVQTLRYQARNGSRGAILYALAQEPVPDLLLPAEEEVELRLSNPDEHRDTTSSTPQELTTSISKDEGSDLLLPPPRKREEVTEGGRSDPRC